MNNSKKADKREIILSIAQKRFAHYGLQKTTIDEIAGEAGISKGLIYHYFPSKEDVFYTVIEKEAKKIIYEIREAVNNEKTTYDKLKAFQKCLLGRLMDAFHIKEIFKDPGDIVFPELMKRFKEFKIETIEIAKSIITEGIETGEFKKLDPHKTALIFTGLIKPIDILVRDYSFDLDEMIDFSLKIFLEGISKEKALR